MREVDAAVDGDRAALAQAPGGRGEIAEAVDRNRDRLVVGRHQEGRGEMAEMMLDGMHGAAELLLRQVPLEVAGDVGAIAALAQAIQHIARADARGQHIGELAPAVGAVVAVDRDVLDVAQRDPGLGQAIADRFAGEAAPMLDAPEALLLDGGDQGAVLHEAGGGIGVVGIQAQGHKPSGSLRRHQTVEIAAQQVHGKDEVGGHALGCIEKPGCSVEYQSLHEQAVHRDGERPQHARAPEAVRPAQLRPRPRRELLRLLRLIARLRLQPALQALAIIVQQAVGDASRRARRCAASRCGRPARSARGRGGTGPAAPDRARPAAAGRRCNR